MSADLNSYLPLIVIALVVLAIAVWALMRASRKARVIDDGSAPAIGRDVLDEGAAPAARNQALIDAPRVIEPTVISNAIAEPAPVIAPITPAPAPAPAPATTPAPAPIPAPATGDDLTRIKGLGPKLAALLGELGVVSYAQIAAWSPQDVERIDAQLGRFSGRIIRDQWIEQAKLLAANDEKTFVSQFGSNG